MEVDTNLVHNTYKFIKYVIFMVSINLLKAKIAKHTSDIYWMKSEPFF